MNKKRSSDLILFKKEIDALEEAKSALNEKDPALSRLSEHCRKLCDQFENLVKAASRITRISDNYQRKFIQANERVEAQKTELERVNLRQKQLLEKLAETNATKDKFFSILAHDLRGAFGSFKMGFDVLSVHVDELDKREIKRVATNLKKSGENFFNLLENLLQWSRLKMGVLKPEPEAVNLASLIGDVFDLMEESARTKNISLHTEVTFEIAALADRRMLFSILQNLISNAIKFSSPGGRVRVSAETPGNMVVLRVSDEGVGMDESMVDRLFRIDSQSTTPGTSGEMGAGLGLILCKEFVEKNKGEIIVESALRSGTTVKVALLPPGRRGCSRDIFGPEY